MSGGQERAKNKRPPLPKAFQPLRTIWKTGAGKGSNQCPPKVLLGRAHVLLCGKTTSGHPTQPTVTSGPGYPETRAMALSSKCIPFGKDHLFALESGQACESNPATARYVFTSPH